MTLRPSQEAMLRLLFAPSPDAADLALLGDDRALVYRELVRGRIEQLLASALPRTLETLDDRQRAIDAFLADGAQASRFFRDLPLLFADGLLTRLPAGPEHLRDVVELERARWWAMIAEEREVPISPFDLERRPLPSTTLTLLAPGWSVHREGPLVRSEDVVVVYRRTDHVVETRWATGTSGRLLCGWARGERTAIEVGRQVLAEEGRPPDAAFAETLGALAASLLEAGALRGSVP